MSSPDLSSRLAPGGRLLVRSEIEISRILASMLEDGDALTADLPAEVMFLSRLLLVEPVQGYMLLACSEHKPANSAALAERKLVLHCNHRGAQFVFSGAAPRPAIHAGQPCIECRLPTVLMALQQRRTVSRVAVPAQAPISCEVRLGPLSFDAEVADVSLDGIGTLIADPAISLRAGMRLERARIRHPQHAPIEVDLEVRYVTGVSLADGKRANRIGCKILSSPADLEELIRLFIIDLV